MAQQNSNGQTSIFRIGTLLAGDILVILSFVFIGRQSHSLSLTDISSSLLTALPFLIGWLAVMPWFGIYKAEVSHNRRKLIFRFLPGWLLAGLLALVLRALFLGRSILTGISPTFALISLGYIGLVGLVWRLGYIWWTGRQQPNQTSNRIKSAEL